MGTIEKAAAASMKYVPPCHANHQYSLVPPPFLHEYDMITTVLNRDIVPE